MASNTEPPHLTEVDGVSCLWAESRGPDIFAALLFRVGVADESMRAGGVSHLVEHLALPSSPISGIDLNGTVDMLTTHFWGQGQPEPALDLIAQIAASLAHPPLARLPLERSILKAEAAQRPSSHWHNALSLRYGPVAHGLGIYEEYGATAATDEQVAEWAATRFTKGNAILYLTGPPPDLVLPLPAGERRPPPLPKPIPYVDYPSVYPIGPEGCVVVSLVADLSAAAVTAINIGVRRLRHRLRVESGTTYHVSWVTEALDGDLMHALITADCLPSEIDSTRGLVIATLDDLAFDGPTAEELAEVAEEFARFVRDPDWLSHNLHSAALSELLGLPFRTFDERIATSEGVTEDEVATALRGALASTLLILPREATVPGGRFSEYPLSSPNRPKPGRVYYRRERRPWHRRPDDLFFTGDQGVMRAQRGQWWAVRYDECVAGLRWKNGGRELWSADGFLVSIRPEEWKQGAAAVRAIDAAAPPEIWIRMDAAESAEAAALEGAIAETEAEARIQLLRVELDRQPEESRLWDQLAAVLIDMEEWASAVDAADRASALDAGDAWARRMKARALVEAGRDAEAIEAISDALHIDAAGLRTLSDAAHILCEAGEAERAVRYADRAVELYPGAGDAWFARGRVFESLGPLEEAEAAYRRAAELEPDDVWWHSNLGGVLVKQGSYEEAIASLRRALELDPWHSAARFSLARAYGLSGDLQRARKLRGASSEKVIEDARAWIAGHPTAASARCRLAEALGELGRPAEGLREMHAALEFAPDDPDTVEQAASSAIDAGEDNEARVHLATLTSTEARTRDSYVEEARLAALLGDVGTATQALHELQERSPSDVQLRLAAGYAAAAGADWEAAGASFLEAIDSSPRNCCAQTWHGLADVEAGDIVSAGAAYERGEALSTCECAARQRLRLATTPK